MAHMRQKVLQLSTEQVDQMIRIKWGGYRANNDQPSYIAYSVLGKIFGVDGSSARRLVLKRLQELR